MSFSIAFWQYNHRRKALEVHVICPVCKRNIRVRQNERVVRHRPPGSKNKGAPLCALGGMQLDDVRKLATVVNEFSAT